MGLLDKAKKKGKAGTSQKTKSKGISSKARVAKGAKVDKKRQQTKAKGTVRSKENKKGLRAKAKESMKVKAIDFKSCDTDFDRLYNMVQEQKKVSFWKISSTFRIKKSLVEEWAQIMEDHNLVTVHYPLVGDPELRKIEENKKQDDR